MLPIPIAPLLLTPTTSWARIRTDIRARIGEPAVGYWTNKELEGWYNEGVAMQHRAVWQALLALEDRSYTETIENDYCRTFLRKSAVASLVDGTSDYDVPNYFWRAVRVTVVVNGTECPADYVPFADDWEVRYLPHRAPSPTRPKYSLTPNGKIRFYVNPGRLGVPSAAADYYVYFMAQPVPVDIEEGGVVDASVLDPFNAAPKAWACYKAMLKQYDDGAPYMQEFQAEVQAITPGTSKDAAERKVVNVTKNYYGQGAGPG